MSSCTSTHQGAWASLLIVLTAVGCGRSCSSEPINETPEHFVIFAPESGAQILDDQGRPIGRFTGTELAWRELIRKNEAGEDLIAVSDPVAGDVLAAELEFCPRSFDSGALVVQRHFWEGWWVRDWDSRQGGARRRCAVSSRTADAAWNLKDLPNAASKSDAVLLEASFRHEGVVESFSLERDTQGVMTLTFSDSPYDRITVTYACIDASPLPVLRP